MYLSRGRNFQVPVSTSSELIVNGTFSAASDWTLGAGWAITGGKLVGTASDTVASQVVTNIVAGESYELKVTVSGYTLGAVSISMNSTGTLLQTDGDGAFVLRFVALASGETLLFSGGAFSGSIDDVSLKKITALTNIITDGTFDGSGWTCGAGWAETGGKGVATASAATISQSITLEIGITYQLIFDTVVTTDAITWSTENNGGDANITTSGTYSYRFDALAASDILSFYAVNLAFTGTIDNVKIFRVSP